MHFSGLAENRQHVFLKPEFDLKIFTPLLQSFVKILLIPSNTNCPCCNVHSSCFIRIRLFELEDDPKKNSVTRNDFRTFKHLKMS